MNIIDINSKKKKVPNLSLPEYGDDYALKALFIKVWGNAMSSDEYKREDWNKLQVLLQERGINV